MKDKAKIYRAKLVLCLAKVSGKKDFLVVFGSIYVSLCVFLIFDIVVNFHKNVHKNENGKELFHVFLSITIPFFHDLISSTFIFLLPRPPSTHPNNLPCYLDFGVVLDKFYYSTIF